MRTGGCGRQWDARSAKRLVYHPPMRRAALAAVLIGVAVSGRAAATNDADAQTS